MDFLYYFSFFYHSSLLTGLLQSSSSSSSDSSFCFVYLLMILSNVFLKNLFYCILQLQSFCLFLFYYLFLVSFCLCIVFLICWIAILFFCSPLSFLKTTIIISLSGKLQNSVSLELVTRRLMWPSGGIKFSWFFVFFEMLHCYFCIWNSHIHWSLQTDLGREMLSISPVQDSGAFSNLLWTHLFHALCSYGSRILKHVWLLLILQCTTLGAETSLLLFQGQSYSLFVVNP